MTFSADPIYTDHLKFQFAFIDKKEIVGVGNAIALNWEKPYTELPENGLDWAIEKANNDTKLGLKPNLLIGVQILINPKYQSQGISYEMLSVMKKIAKSYEIDTIAIPVRPTLKCVYPHMPMTEYINWQNEDQLPYDPWLRVHIKVGGKIVGVCEKSMHISGTISEWEDWTGLSFPHTGTYIIDKALAPIDINKQKDEGTYTEPNVWIIHEIK